MERIEKIDNRIDRKTKDGYNENKETEREKNESYKESALTKVGINSRATLN